MDFDKLAQTVSRGAGRPASFGVAAALVVVWAISGPVFHYSDTWQLVINTGTTIITFLMVFLIQNSQNRDTDALQIKVDELLRVTEGARLQLMQLEELRSSELDDIRRGYVDVGREHGDAESSAIPQGGQPG